MRHLITLADLNAAETEQIFAIAVDLKAKYQQGKREALLPGRVMALLFEKPSLRTRASFECAMTHLGGNTTFLGKEAGFLSRESVADFARVLSQYVDVIVARTFDHQSQIELAKYSGCSIVNGLSNEAHPCQALSDLFTLRERVGRLQGHKLAYVGDGGNNMAHSLARGCAMLGMTFAIASPKSYQLSDEFLQIIKQNFANVELQLSEDPAEVVRDSIAVYTDVWASMGQEEEAESRRRDLAPYQVNAKLLAEAPKDAVFMHCLPAHRGEEVTDEVMDCSQSIVVEQAGNRMHLQKGLLAWLLAKQS